MIEDLRAGAYVATLGFLVFTACSSTAPEKARAWEAIDRPAIGRAYNNSAARADRTVPYHEPQRPMRDSFTFWGWSEDGQRFAYETYSFSGGEPTDCSEAAVLIVYDAVHDRVVPDGSLRVESGAGNDKDHCRIPDVQAVLAMRRSEHLRRHHIIERFVLPGRFETGQDDVWTVALRSGHTARARLRAADLDRADVRQDPTRMGASYRLVLTLEGAEPKEVSTGPRAGALHFEFDDAIAFTDPKRQFVALCIPATYAVAHGTWSHWDCHGLPLRH
jgi:hypothetical protein